MAENPVRFNKKYAQHSNRNNIIREGVNNLANFAIEAGLNKLQERQNLIKLAKEEEEQSKFYEVQLAIDELNKDISLNADKLDPEKIDELYEEKLKESNIFGAIDSLSSEKNKSKLKYSIEASKNDLGYSIAKTRAEEARRNRVGLQKIKNERLISKIGNYARDGNIDQAQNLLMTSFDTDTVEGQADFLAGQEEFLKQTSYSFADISINNPNELEQVIKQAESFWNSKEFNILDEDKQDAIKSETMSRFKKFKEQSEGISKLQKEQINETVKNGWAYSVYADAQYFNQIVNTPDEILTPSNQLKKQTAIFAKEKMFPIGDNQKVSFAELNDSQRELVLENVIREKRPDLYSNLSSLNEELNTYKEKDPISYLVKNQKYSQNLMYDGRNTLNSGEYEDISQFISDRNNAVESARQNNIEVGFLSDYEKNSVISRINNSIDLNNLTDASNVINSIRSNTSEDNFNSIFKDKYKGLAFLSRERGTEYLRGQQIIQKTDFKFPKEFKEFQRNQIGDIFKNNINKRLEVEDAFKSVFASRAVSQNVDLDNISDVEDLVEQVNRDVFNIQDIEVNYTDSNLNEVRRESIFVPEKFKGEDISEIIRDYTDLNTFKLSNEDVYGNNILDSNVNIDFLETVNENIKEGYFGLEPITKNGKKFYHVKSQNGQVLLTPSNQKPLVLNPEFIYREKINRKVDFNDTFEGYGDSIIPDKYSFDNIIQTGKNYLNRNNEE